MFDWGDTKSTPNGKTKARIPELQLQDIDLADILEFNDDFVSSIETNTLINYPVIQDPELWRLPNIDSDQLERFQTFKNDAISNKVCPKCKESGHYASYNQTSKSGQKLTCKNCKNEQERNSIAKKARRAKYRAMKLAATCPTSNKQEIHRIYKHAAFLTNKHKIKYQVDHIRPLSKGGLHHEHNLQIVTQRENLMKSNNENYVLIGLRYIDGNWTKDWI